MGHRDPLDPNLPPHSIEAEQSVIGALLLDNTAWNRIAGVVSEADFYRDDHRHILAHIRKLVEAGRPADVVTIYESIERANEVDQTGGLEYLGAIANATPSAAYIRRYAEIVANLARGRELQAIAESLIRGAGRNPSMAAAAAITALAKVKPVVQAFPPLPRATLVQAASRPQLDFVLPGLLAGTVGMMVGQGAIGKSWLALQIGFALATGRPVAGGLWPAASKGRCVVCYGEDPLPILQERMFWLRRAWQVDNDDAADVDAMLDVYSCVGEDLRIVEKTMAGLVDGPFLPRVAALAHGTRLLILDPLLFLQGGDENDNNVAALLMQRLARVARDTGCAIIVLHHVGKGAGGDNTEEWASARGASAFTTSVRWQCNLRPPSPVEMERLGIAPDMRQYWVRTAVVKSNYGDAGGEQWLHRQVGQGGVLLHETLTPPTGAARPRRKKETCDVL